MVSQPIMTNYIMYNHKVDGLWLLLLLVMITKYCILKVKLVCGQPVVYLQHLWVGKFIGGMQLGWSAAIMEPSGGLRLRQWEIPRESPNMIGCTWWQSHVKLVTVLSAFEINSITCTCSLGFARAYIALDLESLGTRLIYSLMITTLQNCAVFCFCFCFLNFFYLSIILRILRILVVCSQLLKIMPA